MSIRLEQWARSAFAGCGLLELNTIGGKTIGRAFLSTQPRTRTLHSIPGDGCQQDCSSRGPHSGAMEHLIAQDAYDPPFIGADVFIELVSCCAARSSWDMPAFIRSPRIFGPRMLRKRLAMLFPNGKLTWVWLDWGKRYRRLARMSSIAPDTPRPSTCIQASSLSRALHLKLWP